MRAWKHKISLVKVLLIALLAVVLLQGTLPLVALMNSGAKETLEQDEVDLDRRMVDSRMASLETEMTSQWANIAKETDSINETFAAHLAENGLTIDGFMADESAKEAFVERVFPALFDYERTDSTSGVFLVLGNGDDVSSEQGFTGAFLRDSDPSAKTDSNSDLLLERGGKALAREAGIALDSNWMPSFNLMGQGAREADSFFYEPYTAALDYPTIEASMLGYWSMPYVLEDEANDNHKMISYSVPLVYDGKVYGVVGVEVSCTYLLNTCFSLDDLDTNKTAGYAIAYVDDDGSYVPIVGTGVLFGTLQNSGERFVLDESGTRGLYQVRGVEQGDQKVYAAVSPMKLYSSVVPYDKTNWVVCGFVLEDSIYGVGDSLYNSIATIISLCALIGLFATMGVAYGVSAPLKRLVESIRGGVRSMDAFETSVAEIDELHHVIVDLSKTELETQARLQEEKERYRLAVESSSDVFFTIYEDDQTIEIVNSGRYDRVWELDEFWTELEQHCAARRTRDDFIGIMEGQQGIDVEICIAADEYPEPHWFEVSGKVVSAAAEGKRCVVGYIRDIHERKTRELAREKERSLDPVTSLLRFDAGREVIRASRERQPQGIVSMFDLRGFSSIVRNYGITFGDVVLEEFAKLLDKKSAEYGGGSHIAVRVGSDEFLVWAPGLSEIDYSRALRSLRKEFSQIVRHDVIGLRFNAGAVVAHAHDANEVLFRRVRIALAEAKRRDVNSVFWMVDFDGSVEPEPIGEIASTGFMKEVGLPTLALNLLDRRLSISAGMDLLVRRMKQRYDFDNVYITSYDREYRAAKLFYLYKLVPGIDAVDFITRYDDAGDAALQEFCKVGRIVGLDELPSENYGKTPLLRQGEGVVFPMSNDAGYSGGIFMVGTSADLLADKDAIGELWELGTIIQNRINQERLDQSARAKADFLARMSHEIRTPMNGVIGMTDIALQPGQTEERRIDCLQKVRSSSHYLLSLLNDILDMSKIESGKMSLVEGPFSLDDMLDELHSVLDGRFAERNQAFVCDTSWDHPCLVGDAVRLKQVLINLLGNASKYSDVGSRVTLAVAERGVEDGEAVVSFAVIDEGIGIAEEDIKRVFAKFEQVDTTNAWQHGTGLGLPISNYLVHLMGGSIQVESELGRGSTFSFVLRLPIAEASTVPAASAQPAEAPNFNGLHVLVAEDNELNREILTCILENMGCEVSGVSDGQQALDAFIGSPVGYYPVILMDVMMPVMGGLESAHAIRQLARDDAKSVAIVAVSANAFAEDVHRSLASGMDAHVSKPVDAANLGEVLAQVLKEKGSGYAHG